MNTSNHVSQRQEWEGDSGYICDDGVGSNLALEDVQIVDMQMPLIIHSMGNRVTTFEEQPIQSESRDDALDLIDEGLIGDAKHNDSIRSGDSKDLIYNAIGILNMFQDFSANDFGDCSYGAEYLR